MLTCRKEHEKQLRVDWEKRECPEFDGTAEWFLTLIASMARSLYLTGDKDLRANLTAISGAAKAAKELLNTGKDREALSELEKMVKDIRKHKEDGTRITKANSGVKEIT